MEKKIVEYICLFLALVVIGCSLCVAEVQVLPPVKLETCVNLPQIYANSTFQNVTTIQLPNKDLMILNQKMTDNGGGFYNFSFCNTTQTGEYIVNGIGNVDGTLTTWNYAFTVNALGKTFTSSQAILYFLIFIVAFIFFLISIIIGLYLPYNDKRDAMTGYIIATENLKYLKTFSLCISYLMMMLMCYFGWMISFGYLDLTFLGDMFHFAFISMLVMVLPLFIIGFFITIANIIHDEKMSDMLQRGFHVK